MKKKRYISIIMLIIMALSFTGGAFASDEKGDNTIDLSKIKSFAEIKKALKAYPTSFKTKEDAREFWTYYWTHAFPPKDSIFNYDLNFDSVLLKNVMYYGYGSLIPKQEQKHDRYGKALYLGYTKDGRYVTNIEYNEDPMSNPQIIKDTTKYKDHKIKWSGKVRPYQTGYNDIKKVGELYLGKNAPKDDKLKCGRYVLERWAKNVVNRTPEFAGGKDFYTYFGGDLDKFLKAVTITVPPTSRNNGQAVVWFNTANGSTHRTYYIKPTEPVDIMVKQEGFKGTTVKPDGSIRFTFDYKVKGLERVKGKTSIFYVVSAPSEYMNLNDDLISNLRKELPKGTQLDYWFARDRKIGILTMLIPVEIDWNLLNDYQTIYLDLKTSVFNSKYASQNSPLSMFVDEYDNPIAGMNTVVGLNLGHLEKNKRQDINALLGMFDDIKGLKEYKAGGYENNIIYGGLSIQSLELGILGREPNDEYTEEEKPLEYKVEENQKELDILMTVFKVFDITEDNKKTNVILYDEKGKEINKKEIELKGTTNGEEEIIEDIDMKLNLEGLSKGEHKFYAVVNSDFNLTKPYPIEYERADQLENNILEIKVVIPGEEDFEIIANKHKIEVDKKDKGEIELSYNVNLKGTEKEIPTVVDLYRGDKVIESINIKSKGGTSQEVKFKVPIVILEEGINNFYGVVNADYNLKEARPFGIIKK